MSKGMWWEGACVVLVGSEGVVVGVQCVRPGTSAAEVMVVVWDAGKAGRNGWMCSVKDWGARIVGAGGFVCWI